MTDKTENKFPPGAIQYAVLDTRQTEQEFIAECEELWAQYEAVGKDDALKYRQECEWLRGSLLKRTVEAVERLKRCMQERDELGARVLRAEKAIPVGVIVNTAEDFIKHKEQIAELKSLLRWCRSEADFAHCDDSAITRIEEILKDA